MTIIKVTATLTYEYDTEENDLVSNEESALEDVKEMIDGSAVSSNEFEFTVEEMS